MKYANKIWFIDWCSLAFKYYYQTEFTDEQKSIFYGHVEYHIQKYCQEHWPLLTNDGHYPINTIISPKHKLIKLELRASFFTGTDLLSNIEDIRKHHINLYSILMFEGLVMISKPSIYRLDIATNYYTNEPLNSDYLFKDLATPLTGGTYLDPHHRNINNLKEVTGYSVGQRGRKHIFLRVYKKIYDKNKLHDLLRFKDDEYIRVEYEIGGEKLKKYNLNKLDLLLNYQPGQLRNLLELLHYSKRYIFPDENLYKPRIKKGKKKPAQWEFYYESAEAIIRKYFTQEDVERLKKVLHYMDLKTFTTKYKSNDG
jgi:hypothetical protein